MRSIPWRKPSPALVISIVALFVALGGSAYAATKIGTKNIKANAITTGKIKKDAITTSKIKKDAVTGAKIKESSLGPVPSATNATNATNAVNATNWSRYYTSGLKKASVGQTVALGSIGPLTMTGVCVDNGGGNFTAPIYLTTSVNGAFAYNYSGAGYDEGGLKVGEQARIDDGAGGTEAEFGGYSASYSSYFASSPDGSVLLEGAANSGVHVFGADCAFQLSWLNEA